MDLTATMDAPCDPHTLFAWVEDLERYPEWLTIVRRAVPAADSAGTPGAAWAVDLQGRLGPFSRSKRLRMVRTRHQPPMAARFERQELDGRRHSPWVLDVEVTGLAAAGARPGGSRLAMHLHYGGALWLPVIERLLRDEIERSRQRLLGYVTAR